MNDNAGDAAPARGSNQELYEFQLRKAVRESITSRGDSTLFQYFTPRFQKVGWQITGEERGPECIVARPTRPTVGLCPMAAKSARAVIQEAKRAKPLPKLTEVKISPQKRTVKSLRTPEALDKRLGTPECLHADYIPEREVTRLHVWRLAAAPGGRIAGLQPP